MVFKDGAPRWTEKQYGSDPIADLKRGQEAVKGEQVPKVEELKKKKGKLQKIVDTLMS